MKFLAIDPGGTTGVAWANAEFLSSDGGDVGEFDTIELDSVALGGGHGEEVLGIHGCQFCGATDSDSGAVGAGGIGELEVVETLGGLVVDYQPDVVVIEDFILRPSGSHGFGGRAGLSPVRITAGFEVWLFQIINFQGIYLKQSASSAKGVMNDDRLKDAGMWVRGKPHARDAARHLAVAYRRYKAGKT